MKPHIIWVESHTLSGFGLSDKWKCERRQRGGRRRRPHHTNSPRPVVGGPKMWKSKYANLFLPNLTCFKLCGLHNSRKIPEKLDLPLQVEYVHSTGLDENIFDNQYKKNIGKLLIIIVIIRSYQNGYIGLCTVYNYLFKFTFTLCYYFWNAPRIFW